MPLDGNFDGIDWLNGYFRTAHVDFNELRPVLTFALIWNLFETKACKRFANPASIRTSVDSAELQGRLARDRYSPYVEYFRTRYFDEFGNANNFFLGLALTNSDHRLIVERTLRGETQDLNNIVYALLLIAHRIRNNLFHGNKEVSLLHTQTELFRVINGLLVDYIEDIENVGH